MMKHVEMAVAYAITAMSQGSNISLDGGRREMEMNAESIVEEAY